MLVMNYLVGLAIIVFGSFAAEERCSRQGLAIRVFGSFAAEEGCSRHLHLANQEELADLLFFAC